MALKIGVGKSDFADLRESGNYYVDKTELIYELVNNNDNKVTLFTRPRRFGKTLMMSMMENFFNIRKDSKAVFEGLAISEHKEFCKKWMNQYPVIFLSLKDVESEDYDGAYRMLKSCIADLCKKLADIENVKNVNQADRDIFQRLMFQRAEQSDIKNSIKILMRMMNAVYGKKVILLIDEYDVPLARASEKDTPENRYYSRMLDLIRGIMSTSLKDNEFLEFAVITGCLRIAKESIFTGTNNFVSYSIIDNRFSSYFGFSENEVREMLDKFRLTDKAALIKEWYDGYLIGKDHMYCPWDVVNYVADLSNDNDAQPKNYWKNTSHNGILLNFVKRTEFDVTEKFEALMNGECIMQNISDELTYDSLQSSEDNLWSVLLMTGYITKADAEETGEMVSLRIPNREILSIFRDTVVRYFEDTVNTDTIRNLIRALWDKDEKDSGKILSDLLWETISYNDYHEDYYHAFLTGVFVGRGYSVDSNKEKGLGRPDILLKDRKNRRAIIIETKKSVRETDMEKDCEEAVRQIERQRYAEGLNGYNQILCYGIAFYKKEVKIKLMVTVQGT
ncbi:AAA family ATPase [Lachnospiraceae bacterium C1.1]|nr:AAA family ATPase [Lachnospiraceae bacterium C1.1]